MARWQEAYPAVHRALAPEYRGLPEDEVETIVRGIFGEDFGLADAEGFFDDVGKALGRAAQTVAPVVQRAFPGVVSGAMGGAALGPMGMLGGALLGGVGSALGGGARSPAAPPGAHVVPGAMRAAAPAGAIGQLLSVLGSPTVRQALSSMMLGPAGARSVPTPAGGQLPVAAITNLLGMLASRASAEWEALVPTAETESYGYAAESLDLASPEVRSGWVLGQLAPVESEVESTDESSDEGWIDELYDELEAELLAGEASDEDDGEDYERYGTWAEPTWSFAGRG